MLHQTPCKLESTAEIGDPFRVSAAATQPVTQSQSEQLHLQGGPVAWEMEARLIAGQSDELIADRLGLSTETVAEYVTAFCDFRAELDHDTRLFFNAVLGGLTPGGELTEGDIWRLVAWLYGPVGVDLIVDDYHGRTDPENTEEAALAGLLRAQAVVRFVNPRCKGYADALRLTRKHYRRRRDSSARKIVVYCNVLLIVAGWNPKGKGRLASKARRAAIDKLTDEQLANRFQKAAGQD